jgi:hypothetical protein
MGCLTTILLVSTEKLVWFGILLSTLLIIRSTAQLEWSNIASDSAVDVLRPSSLCTVDRVPLEAISVADFEEFYLEKYPLVLQGSNQATFATLTKKACK